MTKREVKNMVMEMHSDDLKKVSDNNYRIKCLSPIRCKDVYQIKELENLRASNDSIRKLMECEVNMIYWVENHRSTYEELFGDEAEDKLNEHGWDHYMTDADNALWG